MVTQSWVFGVRRRPPPPPPPLMLRSMRGARARRRFQSLGRRLRSCSRHFAAFVPANTTVVAVKAKAKIFPCSQEKRLFSPHHHAPPPPPTALSLSRRLLLLFFQLSKGCRDYKTDTLFRKKAGALQTYQHHTLKQENSS